MVSSSRTPPPPGTPWNTRPEPPLAPAEARRRFPALHDDDMSHPLELRLALAIRDSGDRGMKYPCHQWCVEKDMGQQHARQTVKC